jgi:hypothetical protein
MSDAFNGTMTVTEKKTVTVPAEEWNRLVKQVDETHQFVNTVVNILASNPMVRAMLPPDVKAQIPVQGQ